MSWSNFLLRIITVYGLGIRLQGLRGERKMMAPPRISRAVILKAAYCTTNFREVQLALRAPCEDGDDLLADVPHCASGTRSAARSN